MGAKRGGAEYEKDKCFSANRGFGHFVDRLLTANRPDGHGEIARATLFFFGG
jgi:hypothetical protein